MYAEEKNLDVRRVSFNYLFSWSSLLFLEVATGDERRCRQKNDAPDNNAGKGGSLLRSSVSGVNPVSYRPVPSLHCTVSCMEDLWSLSLRNQYTCTDCRLSGLATKQLSAIVAPGASSVEAQEVNVLISFTIPGWCVLICQCVLLICALLSGWSPCPKTQI